jgi:hypothetical protein
MLAAVDLLKKFCLHLLGLTIGLLGLPGNLSADPSFAAGERVAAGVDLHLQAVSSLADHGGILG